MSPLPKLTRVINARGAFTPLGVSRSSPAVARAVARALREHLIISELEAEAESALVRLSGAEAATVVHCTAAAITLGIAATITGLSPERIAALPDTTGMKRQVVLPAGHAVDYGHSIVQAIRLAGASVVLPGAESGCDEAQLSAALEGPDVACLLLVSSRLARGRPLDMRAAVRAAHARGVPVVIDGAAQDFRLAELLATGADLVLVSAQKYLAGPTAGLVFGRRELVRAVGAQQHGVGRAMKPTKEALAGVIVAAAERGSLAVEEWRAEQVRRVERFVARVSGIQGLTAASVPDETGLPFPRGVVKLSGDGSAARAAWLAEQLRGGRPSIWVMDQQASLGRLGFELVPLRDDEITTIVQRLSQLMANHTTSSLA